MRFGSAGVVILLANDLLPRDPFVFNAVQAPKLEIGREEVALRRNIEVRSGQGG